MIKLNRATRKIDSVHLNKSLVGWNSLLDRKNIGFFDLVHRDAGWDAASTHANRIFSKYEKCVFVGIGGSGLGGKMVHQFLGANSPHAEKLIFLENVDPVTLETLFNSNDINKNWHWVIVSKSGATLETLMLANAIHMKLKLLGISLEKVSSIISEDKESPLTRWAEGSKIPHLSIDQDVGGRFSVLTPVGLLPAALLGENTDKIREGALWALQQKDLVVQLAAHILASFERQEWISQFWFYSDQLKFFGDWLQQLWAESLAKKVDQSGGKGPRVSTPSVCVGAIDQHSVLQQVVEGHSDKFLVFSRMHPSYFSDSKVENLFPELSFMNGQSLGQVLDAEANATYLSMEEIGKSAIELEWSGVNPQVLGGSVLLFELLVGTLGEVLNINAYDQPGVEIGKVRTKDILINKR